MVTRQIRVRGRVQGVGYRDSLRIEAQKRGVTGWVRNRSDGTVEALLQGSAGSVDAVVAWARKGPGAARVDAVESIQPESPLSEVYERFEVRPSD